MGRVVVLGSLNLDLVTQVERHPEPGETVLGEGLARLAGGKGANQAMAAAAAGADVAMVGAVGDDSASLGDAGAVCAVLEPEHLTTQRLPVRVELAGTWSRGRTIVDRRDWDGNLAHDPHGQAPASIDVALAVDGDHYSRLWLDTLAGPA